MATNPTRSILRGFTLIEILVVVVILGILAAIISPQFANTALESQMTNVESQLHVLRSAIELHDSRYITDQFDPLNDGNGWTQLVDRNLINYAPKNPMQNDSITVADAAADGVGWVWVDGVNGVTGMLYGVDVDGNQMPY